MRKITAKQMNKDFKGIFLPTLRKYKLLIKNKKIQAS